MGMEKETGTVEKGKAADLIVLSADPSADIANLRRLKHVMRGGVMKPVEELAAAKLQVKAIDAPCGNKPTSGTVDMVLEGGE